ncbi:MAG: bifunctional tRNA (5-methylaminomethyl-2-thiouridine)(34)-methyltransferase MnmD/FAD-dependent 5-carboxymethylaminomethyl-2-thiouridine(34) oxidoreductase MnmC [Bdellovibrionales bacterium]|nr:bifunctional tRNA (5-methylaminomethyl-2-thiouridine)(34)-methyltransferase MnmD/FAD-dependent 5-carboxymethylaminomethyl-2-thiouridine(34) oxidoreductase MnmC [Bdellovibrionales bacterium]
MSELRKRVQIADLEFKNEKTPYSPHFRDIYFSQESGIAESRYVYLEGSGALQSMLSSVPEITISEIGFGAGFNFLLTLREYKNSRNPGTIRYFSFENRPVRKSSLHRLYENYPELQEEARTLLSEYPVLTPGIHLLRFLGGRFSLYLCLGDATELLSRINFHADHWYWDGFAPSRNPDAFSETLFRQVALHSKAGTRGSSFTSAGWVRRILQETGFEVSKRAGYGHKRECIQAEFKGTASEPLTEPWFSTTSQKRLLPGMSVAVIGAGLGGSAIARSLAERGARVTIFDPNGIAGRASSNPTGLFNAQLSKIPNPVSRFSQLSLISLLRELVRLGINTQRGILRTDIRDSAPLLRSDYPDDFFQIREEGVFFPECGLIDPRELCKARLNHPSIDFRNDALMRTHRSDSGILLQFKDEKKSLSFDHVVYCLGADPKLALASGFRDPLHDFNPTRPIRGQIIFVSPIPSSEFLSHALVEEGYATPPVDGVHVIGATYQAKTILPDQEDLDTEALLTTAQKWAEFIDLNRTHVKGTKTGYRLSTPDKLPMIGPLCDPEWMRENYSSSLRGAKNRFGPPLESPPGEWLLTGLGSRGITYSSFGAELLAEWMNGNPIPLELDLLAHIHSARFFVRKLKKSGVE